MVTGSPSVEISRSWKVVSCGVNVNSILSNRVNMETPITLDEIIAAVNKEDLLCIEIVEEIGQKLGKQIAGLINIFNTEF